MAGATGLEPAASGVTGRRSNQLSYAPVIGSDADLNLTRCQVKHNGPFFAAEPKKGSDRREIRLRSTGRRCRNGQSRGW